MQTEGVGFEGLHTMLSDVRLDIERLSLVSSDEAGSQQSSQAHTAEAPRSDGSRRRIMFVAALIGTITVVIWIISIAPNSANNLNSGAATADQAATTAAGAAAAADAAAAIEATPPTTEPSSVYESAPAKNADQALNVNEIAYCLSQSVRVQSASISVDNRNFRQVDAFNYIVEDYNARCGRYRYISNDMLLAQEYVEQNRSRLQLEGAGLVAVTATPEPITPIPPIDPSEAPSNVPSEEVIAEETVDP